MKKKIIFFFGSIYVGLLSVVCEFLFLLETFISFLLSLIELFIRPFYRNEKNFHIILVNKRTDFLYKILDFHAYINELDCKIQNNNN
jgi:hypothetical protein